MNVGEIKNTVMFQTNNDIDDLADYLPYLTDYINEGYDKLMYAYAGEHLSEDKAPTLRAATDSPHLPEWTHRAIADYATYMVYRNGNPQKQHRGYAYLSAFNEAQSAIKGQGGDKGKARHFFNIPD